MSIYAEDLDDCEEVSSGCHEKLIFVPQNLDARPEAKVSSADQGIWSGNIAHHFRTLGCNQCGTKEGYFQT